MNFFVVFVLFFQVLFLGSSSLTAQVRPVDFKTVEKLMQKEPKPILVLLTTDWCSYCRIQKKQLAENKFFADNSSKFYFVEFDAESTDEVVFHNHKFINTNVNNKFGNKKGFHQLAIALNQSENIAFPTWVILNDKYEIIFKNNGLLTPKEIKKIINKL